MEKNNTINGRTPEEIKRGLECCKPVWVDDHWKTCDVKCPYIDDVGGFCRAKLMADAIALVQQFEPAQPKWISVEDRLPEHGEVVMVFAKVKPDEEALLRDLLSFASYWCDDGWVVDFIDDTDDITVTHWMPLPSTEEIE